jgi:hypothetical protein
MVLLESEKEMTTHITVPQKQGDSMVCSCFKCSFKVLMSWTPEYAAAVVDVGDPDITHLAQGQVFEYGKSEGYSLVPFEERGEVPKTETSQLTLTFQPRGSSSSGHG